VLAPASYADRKQIMLDAIHTVRALWRGETVPVQSVAGLPTEVRTYPRPIQKELPVWIISAGNVETSVRIY
jgi:alkanesulfonate monooxygenase SsuD/methylene tetrahydromethanopterin reductase-like flavin-dependent oxidoreductase (luciferase family)